MVAQHTYQPPLTHRASGPGLILVLSDRYAHAQPPNKSVRLDPPPLQKWAEEGFCVLAFTVPDQTSVEHWGEILADGIAQLKKKPERQGGRFGVIVYEPNLSEEITQIPNIPSEICSLVLYLNHPHASSVGATSCPQLRHVSTFDLTVGKQQVEDAIGQGGTISPINTYEYVRSTTGSGTGSANLSSFIHPSSPDYNHTHATLAHTRTLTFLRTYMGGPSFDIEAIWEAHTRFEFEGRDVDGTMGTMVAEPYVNHIPTLTGGMGREALTSFYARHFIHSNPASTRMELISRTIGPDRVVDEFVFEFTHDVEMDWMLPGVPPTGKHVRVPFVAVVNVRGDKLYHEHIYWDQASVLAQIGLLPSHLAFSGSTQEIRLPVVGIDQAEKMINPNAPQSNLLIQRKE